MNNNPQRRLLNSHFDRSAANVFTIGINIEWMLRFHAQARSRKIFDLADAKMPPKINAGKHAEQLERIDPAHHADIEQAVVHLRAGSDLHPSAIHGSVGEGRKDCGLMAANGPAFMPRRIQAVLIRRGNLHRKRRKPKYRWDQTQRVSAVSAQPSRQTIRPPRDFAIEAGARDTTEVASFES